MGNRWLETSDWKERLREGREGGREGGEQRRKERKKTEKMEVGKEEEEE